MNPDDAQEDDAGRPSRDWLSSEDRVAHDAWVEELAQKYWPDAVGKSKGWRPWARWVAAISEAALAVEFALVGARVNEWPEEHSQGFLRGVAERLADAAKALDVQADTYPGHVALLQRVAGGVDRLDDLRRALREAVGAAELLVAPARKGRPPKKVNDDLGGEVCFSVRSVLPRAWAVLSSYSNEATDEAYVGFAHEIVSHYDPRIGRSWIEDATRGRKRALHGRRRRPRR